MMAIPSIPTPDDKDKPSHISEAYKEMHTELEICRDVDGGYLQVKAKGVVYLPQHPRERADDYQIRLKRPAFFNGFSRTHSGLTGMVFRIEPVLGEDVPDPLVKLWENIDNQGSHGNVFLKEVFDDGIVAGHAAILVDAPTVETKKGKKRTKLDDMKEGVRPYWVHVKKDDLINVQYEVVNGQQVLALAVIREIVEEQDGVFGAERFEQFRVLRRGPPVTFELWRNIGGKVEVYQEEKPITNVTEIPLVPFYTDQTGFFMSRPPLIDLAHANILHYQTNSDMLHAAHIANVPILFGKGFKADSVEVGPNSGIFIGAGGADVDCKWLETSGTGIGLTLEILKQIEAGMAVLGLNMLVRETRAAETAEAKRLDKSEQDSALASAAQSLQDATENALKFTAEFMKLPEGGTVTVNRDFMPEGMTPELIAKLSNMVASSQLSLETMWLILGEGGILPDDFDAELEKEQIEAGTMIVEPPEPEPEEEEEEEE
jgi:hypothetical protein